MYTGTLPSNDDGTDQLFFWMYRADDDSLPLTIWMNGGPGSSSIFGNFLENGPMRITRDGDDPSTGYMINTVDSWDQASHMVFVD